MPSGGDPLPPDHHGEDVVKLKRPDGGATAGGPPGDARASLAPRKMSLPFLLAGMEKSNPASGQRIAPVSLRPLVAVAQAAGQPQIVFNIVSAARLRDDVINFELAENVALPAQAVATSVPGLLSHPLADGATNVAGSHGASGSISPRRTASLSACALRNSPS